MRTSSFSSQMGHGLYEYCVPLECRRLNSGTLGLAGGEMDIGDGGPVNRYDGSRCRVTADGSAAPFGVVMVGESNSLNGYNCAYKK
jgi:hypothetical protein